VRPAAVVIKKPTVELAPFTEVEPLTELRPLTSPLETGGAAEPSYEALLTTRVAAAVPARDRRRCRAENQPASSSVGAASPDAG
jgi:hypothetical protein